jgi:hypothetical protein
MTLPTYNAQRLARINAARKHMYRVPKLEVSFLRVVFDNLAPILSKNRFVYTAGLCTQKILYRFRDLHDVLS